MINITPPAEGRKYKLGAEAPESKMQNPESIAECAIWNYTVLPKIPIEKTHVNLKNKSKL